MPTRPLTKPSPRRPHLPNDACNDMRQYSNIPCTIQRRGTQVLMMANRHVYAYDMRQQPLGAGAMGTVYKGWDTHTGQPVAIKLVNPQYAAIPSVRRRARQEADLQYRHPNLIEMLGCCEDGTVDGPMFIVSNFVHGIELDKHVRQKLENLDRRTDRICRTLYPVFEALSYLHKKNVYHLDIKPSNIMVEDGRNVRLMDLGIANTRGDAEITSAGLLGTPGYAAPEQYVYPGKPMQVDGRTDLYQMGVTLYELIAGHRPDPERIEDIPGVSRPLMQVLRRSMHKDPEQRYADAESMRAAIETALTTPEKKTNWIKIISIAAGILLLLIMGCAFAVAAIFM